MIADSGNVVFSRHFFWPIGKEICSVRIVLCVLLQKNRVKRSLVTHPLRRVRISIPDIDEY